MTSLSDWLVRGLFVLAYWTLRDFLSDHPRLNLIWHASLVLVLLWFVWPLGLILGAWFTWTLFWPTWRDYRDTRAADRAWKDAHPHP